MESFTTENWMLFLSCVGLFVLFNFERRRANKWRERWMEESDKYFLLLKKLELAHYALGLSGKSIKDFLEERGADKKSEDIFG